MAARFGGFGPDSRDFEGRSKLAGSATAHGIILRGLMVLSAADRVCGEFLALLRHIWCFHAGLEGFRGPAPSMALCLPWRDPVRAAGGVDGVDGVGVVSGSGLGAFGHFWTIWTIWCDPFEDSTPRRLLLSTS